MHQGHHGANHPVKDFTTGKVEITSMNHGFAVDRDDAAGGRRGNARVAVRRLQLRAAPQGQAGVLGAVPPRGLARSRGQPHLFSCIPSRGLPARDSHYLFTRFVNLMREQKGLPAKPERLDKVGHPVSLSYHQPLFARSREHE